MCGIAGYYSPNNRFGQKDLVAMTNKLEHRGPDAEGFFMENAVGLGHRRLSIIDLSSAANQPMFSACGRYVISFNGEVYNFRELAKQFDLHLKTSSDTEVILELFATKGIEVIQHFNGMFAMAIYDRETQKLTLIRDRIGVKPLYYYWDGSNLAFASETKALLELPITRSINRTALQDYLFLEYIVGNQSIFDNIQKLENGHWLEYDGNELKTHCYYDLLKQLKPDESTLKVNENQIQNYCETFKQAMRKSIHYRMISDVPIGAFLSGGTDSSLICAIFQEINDKPINSFTIGFDIGKSVV